MSNEIKNIYEAINAVMSKVGYVQKQRAAGLNYTYAGEAALIEAIRPWLVEFGIVVHPVVVQEVRYDSYTTAKGSVMNVTNVVAMYRFCHAPSGTSFDVPVLGEGADTGDKSGNKALTGAFKYALRQTLMIETGDDPDGHQSEPGSKRQGQGQRKPVVQSPRTAVLPQQAQTTTPARVDTATGEIAGNGGNSDPRGEMSPPAQAAREHLRPKAGDTGKQPDWRKIALSARSISQFSSAAHHLLQKHDSEQHLRRVLEEQPSFTYDPANNEELLKWLETH